MTVNDTKVNSTEFKLSSTALKTIEHILERSNKDSRNLIQILQDLQEEFHYLPEKVISHISHELQISEHHVYGVATFYSQFKFIEPGENIVRVCMGTACHVLGAQSLLDKLARELKIEPGETTKDGLFSLESVYCLGCCALAPVMVINDEVFGNMTAAKVNKILRRYRKSNKRNANNLRGEK
ncbi:MAG: NADH-quinone oxidoreductase subunit NuoE [Candidatus Heimdallarchaeota archaeon]|nr:NADH-quinone oxidoreductase subunit NuoE [Candidatus Heimdallarchaeota archaeon]